MKIYFKLLFASLFLVNSFCLMKIMRNVVEAKICHITVGFCNAGAYILQTKVSFIPQEREEGEDK